MFIVIIYISLTMINLAFSELIWLGMIRSIFMGGFKLVRFSSNAIFNQTFCKVQMHITHLLHTEMLLLVIVHEATRYALIFWIKNPTRVEDNFWICFMMNSNIEWIDSSKNSVRYGRNQAKLTKKKNIYCKLKNVSEKIIKKKQQTTLQA